LALGLVRGLLVVLELVQRRLLVLELPPVHLLAVLRLLPLLQNLMALLDLHFQS